VRIPSVAVANSIALTVQFQGLANVAGDRAAVVKWASPTIGSTAGTYVEFVGGSWTTIAGNLGMSVWATGLSLGYDGFPSYTGAYFPSPNEYGDDVSLENPHRRLTQLELAYYGDINVPVGDESATVRIYNRDPITYEPVGAALFTTTVPVLDDFNTITVNPNVTVQEDFIYTVEFNNMAAVAGDQAGLTTADPPVAGWSDDYFWAFEGNPDWQAYLLSGGFVANYRARVTMAAATDIVPTSGTVAPGGTISGSFSNLAADDASYWVTRPGVVLVSSNPPNVITCGYTSPILNPNELRVIYDGKTSSSVGLEIQLNLTGTANWETVEALRPGTTVDQYIECSLIGGLTRFINQTTGAVSARVRFRAIGAILVYPWTQSCDQLILRVY
jgi:hypothetical protein